MSALDDVTEQIVRKASVASATIAADLEQASRVQSNVEHEEYTQSERKANQRRASKMLDAEQTRRVAETAAASKEEENIRILNQADAVKQMEAERERRSSLNLEADAAIIEQERNRKASLEAQDTERKERVNSHGTTPLGSPLKKCFNALKKN